MVLTGGGGRIFCGGGDLRQCNAMSNDASLDALAARRRDRKFDFDLTKHTASTPAPNDLKRPPVPRSFAFDLRCFRNALRVARNDLPAREESHLPHAVRQHGRPPPASKSQYNSGPLPPCLHEEALIDLVDRTVHALAAIEPLSYQDLHLSETELRNMWPNHSRSWISPFDDRVNFLGEAGCTRIPAGGGLSMNPLVSTALLN